MFEVTNFSRGYPPPRALQPTIQLAWLLRVLVSLLLSIEVCAEDWPEFRGSTGQGVSSERGLPLTWSETKNVRWKVATPGNG